MSLSPRWLRALKSLYQDKQTQRQSLPLMSGPPLSPSPPLLPAPVKVLPTQTAAESWVAAVEGKQTDIGGAQVCHAFGRNGLLW